MDYVVTVDGKFKYWVQAENEEDGSPACRVMVPYIGWKVAEFK